VDVLHGVETNEEDQGTLPHAVEDPTPEHPFIEEFIFIIVDSKKTYR
jgi:hypothetical protein